MSPSTSDRRPSGPSPIVRFEAVHVSEDPSISFASVQRWLVERAALEPGLLRGPAFESLVRERVREMAGGSERRYVELLDHSAEEADRLVGGVAVPESWLFRYPRSFDLLVEHLRRAAARPATSPAPRRERAPEGRGGVVAPPLELVSLGCAAGQEAWSMAAAARRAGLSAGEVIIHAVDRNGALLRIAERGEYPERALRDDAPSWAMEHLHRRGDGVVIPDELRGMVRFEQADARHWIARRAPGSCTAIFFRNVLIYLGHEARRAMMHAIVAALAEDGLVFLGHAEHVAELPASLRPLRAAHAFAFSKQVEVAGPGSMEQAPASEASRVASRAAPPTPPRAAPQLRANTEARLPAPPSAPEAGRTAGSGIRPHADGSAAAAGAGLASSPLQGPVPASVPAPASLVEARRAADAGLLAEAESIARSVVATHGPSADASELLGLIAAARDERDAARRAFEHAIFLEPQRSESLLQLALLLERDGDVRRAAALRRRAVRSETSDAAARRRPGGGSEGGSP